MIGLKSYYSELVHSFSNGLTSQDYLQWNKLTAVKDEFIKSFKSEIANNSFIEFVECEILSLSTEKNSSDIGLAEISQEFSVSTRLEVLMFLIVDEEIDLSYELLNNLENTILRIQKEEYSLLYQFIDLICQNEYCQYLHEMNRLIALLPDKYTDETIVLQVETFRESCSMN